MPRALVRNVKNAENDRRKLAKAARKERNPIKFVYLLKQLYDVVNESKESKQQPRVSGKAKHSRPGRARVQHELAAA